MTLKLVGAGLGRTGTMSLKLALEKLLEGPVYHMLEVFPRPEHVALWHDAAKGGKLDTDALFDGFVACVDWPACSFWKDIAAENPDAPILLSTRSDAEAWFNSCDRTIFELFRQPPTPDDAWRAMVDDMMAATFTSQIPDHDAAVAAYDRWNADVRATADPSRLVEWQPGDGWEPLCGALGVAVPDEPFPHANTTKEFRDRAGWD